MYVCIRPPRERIKIGPLTYNPVIEDIRNVNSLHL